MATSKRLPVGEARALPGGGWEIEITDRRLLFASLGQPLVAAFCRCFIHADRLNSLSSFALLSAKTYGETSVAHERNLHTMFWYVTGTLLEFQSAINGLVGALRTAGIRHSRLNGWGVVRELQTWSRSPLLRRLRNKVAFHVDEPELRAGLQALSSGRRRWLLARGDDRRMETTQVPFGLEPLFKGLRIRGRDMHHLIKGAAGRQLRIPGALQQMFLAALRKKGVGLQA